jgi:hypothetical protein
MDRLVLNFLKRNGFNWMEPHHYANDMCGVVYDKDVKGLVIADNSGYTRFVKNDLYAVIGCLTYHKFLGKNYVD